MNLDMPPGEASDDTDVFTRFIRAMVVPLRRYVAKRVAPDDVQDVLAQTFLTLWRLWSQRPGEPDRCRAWVFGIARTTIRSTHGRAARRRLLVERIALRDAPQPVPSPERAALSDAQVGLLLDALPPEQREAVQAAVLDDVPLAELAARLQISMTALTSRLHRARIALRAAVERMQTPAEEGTGHEQ